MATLTMEREERGVFGEYAGSGLVQNPAVYAMALLQREMQGKFEPAGLGSDEAINDYVAKIRSEIADR